jgi:hypothetical protein
MAAMVVSLLKRASFEGRQDTASNPWPAFLSNVGHPLLSDRKRYWEG